VDEDAQFPLIIGLIPNGLNKFTSFAIGQLKKFDSFGNELEISLVAITYTSQLGWDHNLGIDSTPIKNTN